MCDPVTIAGIALSAGSTLVNSMAQSKVQNARNDAMAAERIRQTGLDKQADALNAQSQDRYEGFEDKQGEKAKSLGEYFTQQEIAPAPPGDALPTSASNIVVTNEETEKGKAKEFTDRTGKALGNLRAFGDLLGGISREQARDALSIGQIGGLKRGSSEVLPYELEAANEKGAGLRMFGDILGGVGGIATNAGLSGTGPSFGSLFGGGAKTAGSVVSKVDPWAGARAVTTKPLGLSLYPKSNAHTVRL